MFQPLPQIIVIRLGFSSTPVHQLTVSSIPYLRYNRGSAQAYNAPNLQVEGGRRLDLH